jgi:hypothetical protein
MEQEKTNLIPKPLPFATFVVVGHFAVVIWHLLLLVKVQPSTPRIALILLVTINMVPVAGVAFAKVITGWPGLLLSFLSALH